MTTTVLASVPTEILEEEVSKRREAVRKSRLGKRFGRYAFTVKLSKCLGCKKEFSARDMRTHKCPSGWGYNRRVGKVYDKKQKKYVFPEELK